MKIVLHNFPVDGALLMYLASHMNIIRIKNILHHLVFILRLRLIHLVQNIQSYIKVASIETLVFSRTDILYDY